MKVYLAGPVWHTDDWGMTWRELVKEEWDDIGIKWLDPVAEMQWDPEATPVEELVAGDKQMIDRADVILVGDTGGRSPGTWREVEYGIQNGKDIYIWIGPLPMDMLVKERPFSGWMEEAGPISARLDELIEMMVS